jgi:hypothetical protein
MWPARSAAWAIFSSIKSADKERAALTESHTLTAVRQTRPEQFEPCVKTVKRNLAESTPHANDRK